MKTRKVNRYYCDFCKKSGCSSYHLQRHELKCTLNPNRVCGMCKMLGEKQPKMEWMKEILPDPLTFKKKDEYGLWTYDGLAETMTTVLPELRRRSNDCPVCILSALRQSGIIVPIVQEFDYKTELQKAFDTINAESYASEERYEMFQ